MRPSAHLWGTVGRVALLVVSRHWLIGLENAALTLLLGSALVALIRLCAGPIAAPSTILGLQRIVYLVALYKAAFYLVVGDSVVMGRLNRVLWGVQFPDPGQVFDLHADSMFSIWRPAPFTFYVTLLLIVYTLVRLAMRTRSMMAVWDALCRYAVPLDLEVSERLSFLMARAASAIGRPDLSRTGVLIVEDTFKGSPFVVGFRSPRVVISFALLHRLMEQDERLETALRHELMHIARRDHIFRWVQICGADVASLLPVTGHLSMGAIGIEEQLCDIGAIKEPVDAQHLSKAIVEASRADTFRSAAFANASRAVAMPGLICLLGKHDRDQHALVVRLKQLVAYTQTLKSRTNSASHSGLTRVLIFLGRTIRWTASGGLLCMLLLILWARFYAFWMTRYGKSLCGFSISN